MLKKHIVLECFEKEMEKNNIDSNIKEDNKLNINYNTVNNTTVNNIINNTFNNTNITFNITSPIPFDQNWDVSKIDDKQKLILFLEDKKYSKTMEEILQNEKNLNIILDKDSDLGLIYKNDVEKFINMKSNDIIDKAMNKIYNHLAEFLSLHYRTSKLNHTSYWSNIDKIDEVKLPKDNQTLFNQYSYRQLAKSRGLSYSYPH
jgi:hypothetical protein